MLDPAIVLALGAAMALLFASTAFHKAADFGRFRATLAAYQVMPESITAVAASFVVALEIGLAVGFVAPGLRVIASASAAALLSLYTAAIAVNLVRGRYDMDCGCGGRDSHQPINAGLLLRNAVLIVAALAAGAPAGTRPLLWIDGVTLAGTLSCAALLWTAINGLLAVDGRRIAAARINS
jgi:hypothetical protein